MLYEAIDSVYLAAHDLGTACSPYEKLGLKLYAPRDGCRGLLVGGPTDLFSVRFLAAASGEPLAGAAGKAVSAGKALFAVALHVPDLNRAVTLLTSRGLGPTTFCDGDGRLAWLPLHDRAGTDVLLVQRAETVRHRHAAALQAGLLTHAPDLRRLDHLAAVTHDLDAKTRFWTDVLGVPVAGEVTTPALVIRQLRIGGAVLELLGPANRDRPLGQRPPGLVGMASWEVTDLDAAVSHARAAGFSVSDPVTGALPGTRVATIPGSELAGVNMQLLQYV